MSRTGAHALWVQSMASEFGLDSRPLLCYEDNTSAIDIAKNYIINSKSKHINVKYHFIRDLVINGDVLLSYLPTNLMVADIFTKSLPRQLHALFVEGLGLFH